MTILRAQFNQFSGKKILFSLLMATSLVASGCATDRMTTGSVNRSAKKSTYNMTVPELNNARAYWTKAYTKKPKDKRIGLNYANILRMTGRNEQALAVMQQMVIAHPKDRQVLAAYGKALAGAGQLQKALGVIERAYTPDNPDWRLLSTQGAILDQMGKPDQARKIYRKALDISPNESSVLSNLGMSHLLTGDLKTAESYLRSAINAPRPESRVRQNLALVIGLQGRFGEAEKIAAGELSPDQARANIAYLRKILSEQNAWNQLKDKPKKKKKG